MRDCWRSPHSGSSDRWSPIHYKCTIKGEGLEVERERPDVLSREAYVMVDLYFAKEYRPCGFRERWQGRP
jgi:hypothetical protein